MLDQERQSHDSSDSVPTLESISIPESSPSEDESHSKRRASPTELAPGSVTMNDIEMTDGERVIHGGGGGANLVKRPSFKKMRSSTVEGISLAKLQGLGASGAGSPEKKNPTG